MRKFPILSTLVAAVIVVAALTDVFLIDPAYEPSSMAVAKEVPPVQRYDGAAYQCPGSDVIYDDTYDVCGEVQSRQGSEWK